jgi:hypothetical protein
VDKARTERAARVRRVLSRAAIVLGGAVAGTAAAWLLSTSGASADTGAPQVAQPVVDALSAPADTKLPPVVTHAVDTMVPTPPAPPKELTDLSKHVQGAFDGAVSQVGAKVAEHLTPPARSEIPDNTAPVRLRLLAIGDHDTSPVVLPVAAVQNAPVGHEHVAAHDLTRQPTVKQVRTVGRHQGEPAPALPGLPPLPAPLAPPTAPSGSCTSCGHGSDDDRGLPIAHTWPAPHVGSATSHALRMTTQHVAPAVGEQPGVTPD